MNKKIFVSLCSLFLFSAPVQAQLIPDNTLGSENSRVVPVNAVRDRIEGGATRGTNLFHSFERFGVAPGREVYFNNPVGVQNIINRVTGGNISEIFGTLGVNGNANLYIINPNGIVFGDGARLDINGTFIGTTADGVRLGTNDVYSASDPASSSLLTIRPEALFVNRFRQAQRTITNQGNLAANPGASLTLSADEINNNGLIFLPGGNVFLEAVNGDINTGNIEVSLLGINGEPIGNGGNIELVSSENIIIENSSRISAEGILGGNININSQKELRGNNARFSSLSLGNTIGKGGDININSNSIILSDGSRIDTTTFGEGNGGNININAKTIELIGVSSINGAPTSLVARSQGNGNAGNVTIDTDSIILRDGAAIDTRTRFGGNGGNITITANTIELFGEKVNEFSNSLFAQTVGDGDAGDVRINTNLIRLSDVAQIDTTTFGEGNGGNINITARTIELIGAAIDSDGNTVSSGLFAVSRGNGNGGNITIDTDVIRLIDGGSINIDSNVNGGNSGNLTITAREIELFSASPLFPLPSGIISRTLGKGKSGNLTISTKAIRLRDGAQISTVTFGEGNGGNLTITAEEIELIGVNSVDGSSSGLFSSAIDFFSDGTGTGNGGDITIATGRLTIAEGATISASNFQSANLTLPGLGRAGNIDIAAEEIALDRGRITASGNIRGGGEININSSNFIELANQSEITTNVGETQGFTGGNLNISTPIIIANPDNNRISATAVTSAGGNININTNAILGFPQFLTIDASSDLGIDGTVNINGLSDELTRGSLLTPTPVIDAAAILANDICAIKDGEVAGGSSFTIPGKGGIIPNPLETVERSRQPVEWSNRSDDRSKIKFDRQQSSNTTAQQPKTLQPAVGWYRRTDGTVVLTSEPTKVRPLHMPVDYPSDCPN